MAGTRRILTPKQSAQLETIRDMYTRFKIAKVNMRAEIKRETERRLAEKETALSLAIRQAVESGVPISHIGEDAMGTTDPGTPRRWLKKTDGLAVAMAQTEPWFELTDKGDVKVRIEGFPTTSREDVNFPYPEILEGVAHFDKKGKAWTVKLDPGTTESEFGTVPGWFTWELERGNVEGSLVSMIQEWADEK